MASTGASKARVAPALNGPGGGGYPYLISGKKPKQSPDFLKIDSMSYPHDLGKYYMNIQISDYRRETVFVGSDVNLTSRGLILNLTGNITLPVPTQLVDHHHVLYTEEDLGLIKGGVTNGSGDIGQWLDEQVNTLAGAGNKVLDLLGFGAITQSQFGVAPNEFLTVLMKGPAYKQYQMNWRLSPRTSAESETIRKIIATINQKMAPRPSGAIWGYPSVFQISLVPNERFMYAFKPAMIEDFQVNYTPNGVGAFMAKTGAPESVDMTINFKEIEFWSPEDFHP